MSDIKNDLLCAMKAHSIPEGWAGLWYVSKATIKEPTPKQYRGKPVILPQGDYTFLFRLTDSTIYHSPPGECVMEDTPFELQTHIGFIMQAHGDVLVTGLGLGCVVRGLLANPNVKSVTCIENSDDVIKLVADHMPSGRLGIIKADAFEWVEHNKQKFDCAWHDLWTDRDGGEPHLDVWHIRLIVNCSRFVRRQGAWALDRQIKRRMAMRGFRWMG